ncbi:uncharacterized protein [Narcine bancroftii]|uniref:uncharacterized protein isoform X2 n=1 Tax=Narcine bancroftii TaxID=1343680 RepID=UPI003831FD40
MVEMGRCQKIEDWQICRVGTKEGHPQAFRTCSGIRQPRVYVKLLRGFRRQRYVGRRFGREPVFKENSEKAEAGDLRTSQNSKNGGGIQTNKSQQEQMELEQLLTDELLLTACKEVGVPRHHEVQPICNAFPEAEPKETFQCSTLRLQENHEIMSSLLSKELSQKYNRTIERYITENRPFGPFSLSQPLFC